MGYHGRLRRGEDASSRAAVGIHVQIDVQAPGALQPPDTPKYVADYVKRQLDTVIDSSQVSGRVCRRARAGWHGAPRSVRAGWRCARDRGGGSARVARRGDVSPHESR